MIPTQYKFNRVYKDSPAQLKEELSVLTLENIKRYPGFKSKWDDFYEVWLRFGPEAARTLLIPYICDGRLPTVAEAKHG